MGDYTIIKKFEEFVNHFFEGEILEKNHGGLDKWFKVIYQKLIKMVHIHLVEEKTLLKEDIQSVEK